MSQEVENIFKNGATWLRADFHLHTKADKEFKKSDFTDDGDFYVKYIQKLNEQKIKLGVITNHNKFNKLEFKALKKNAKKEDIRLFAGVELSLKEGIHILIVFDDQWYQGETDQINKFLDTAFYGIENYGNPPYRNANFDLKETVDKLNKIEYDYFIVLAHVDDTNGLFTELKGRTLEDFVKQESFSRVLAIQKSANLDNYNKLGNWLDRKNNIACVEGSDNAHEGINGIGNGRVTYIKIGDFNFEALRYALTDRDYRVSAKDKPVIKNGYIKSIAFEGGLLDKTRIDFSPELNTIIGIRGSGKSSLLEVLRYALGISLPDNAADPNYKNSLVERTIGSGGKIIVNIVNKQNVEYRIEKIYGEKEKIYQNNILQPDISIDGTGFNSLIYFGQKDLSTNKDDGSEDDLIQRLIGTRLKEIRLKIEQKKSAVELIISEFKKLENLEDLKKETETQLKDWEHQFLIFKDNGVEDKLKQQTNFDADISKMNEYKLTVNNYLNELNILISNYDYFFQQEIAGSEMNKELFEETKTINQELKIEFERLKTIQNNSTLSQQKLDKLIEKIHTKKEALKEEFAKMKREINTDTIHPDNFLNLNRKIETARLKLKEIDKSEKRRDDLKNNLLTSLTELDSIWVEEYNILNEEVKKINEAESKISIEVECKGNKSKFTKKMKDIFKGTNIRETTYQEITNKYSDFIEIYRDDSLLKDILNENQVFNFKKIFSENLANLLTFKVDSKIIIKYKAKPLNEYSLGQRASALILFLLAQKENDVLIIDQPEDDLDNQTIYDEVIKKIKRIKGSMQFIFATHNANIPVLGDSEKVISCSYDEKKITVHAGTIDHHETQQKIVDIMEGGDEAFSRRKNIYSIWNIEKIKSK